MAGYYYEKKPPRPARKCAFCRELFTPANKGGPGQYCSNRCRQKDKRHRAKRQLVRFCEHCKGPIPAQVRDNATRFCSKKCRRKAEYTQRKSAHQAGRCIDCGKPRDMFLLHGRCKACQRVNTKSQRKIRGSGGSYLGARSSNYRTDKLISVAKADPILASNWNDVKDWISANAELWYEKIDAPLFEHDKLNLTDSGILNRVLLQAWYERLGGYMDLETYVITAVDHQQRDLRRRRA